MAVFAAGGLVRRRHGQATELVVVFRSQYGDWTLPKGKLEPGETAEQAALREVREETGLECRLLRPLPAHEYVDNRGRRKSVTYWVMEPVSGELGAQNEVDEARWAPVDEALRLLTHQADRELVRANLTDEAEH